MLERIESLMKRRTTFAIETTLATRSYKQLVLKAKKMVIKLCCCFSGFRLLSKQNNV